MVESERETHLVYDALKYCDGACPDGVQGEEHVIGLDRDDSPRVAGHVLLLDGWDPEQGHVVAAVECEAHDVEANKVKVEANNTEKKMSKLGKRRETKTFSV